MWRDLILCKRLYEITITYATFLISSISHVISASSCRSICMLACNYKNISDILNLFYTWDYKRWNLYCLPSLRKYEFFLLFSYSTILFTQMQMLNDYVCTAWVETGFMFDEWNKIGNVYENVNYMVFHPKWAVG